MTVITEDSNSLLIVVLSVVSMQSSVVGHVPRVQAPEFHYRELVLPFSASFAIRDEE